MDLDAALLTYIAESRELLEEMEEILLRIDQPEDRHDNLNAIFRAAHTIKGSAGLFGLDDIVSFTHGVESVLDQLRSGSMPLNEELINTLFQCRDHITDLIDHVESSSETLADELTKKGDNLTAQLQIHNQGEGEDTQQNNLPADTFDKSEKSVERISGNQATNNNWHISLRFGTDSLRDGMDPLSFLRYLTTLGEIVNIRTLDDALPSVEEMDPESCYLGFEIDFQTDADKQTIENVFEFIRQDSIVRILPPNSQLEDYIEHIKALPEEDMRLGEILVMSGSLTQAELDEALNLQNQTESDQYKRPLGDIVLENKLTSPEVLTAAVDKQTKVRDGLTRESKSIRVDAEKLDELINLIGELVIAGAGSALAVKASKDTILNESVANVTSLVEEVRDAALRLRMVQIGSTFNRFQRVVRDVSKELGKDIELIINGADTELDKTVVEKIGDPLMHLVRNAIDHGIESAEVRRANNKSPVGTVKLNAYHDSGSIVIEVADDGAGIDSARILKKAIEKGLVAEDAQLEDHEIYNLIFEPGFSTADSVTNLSGRGVGMDVVKQNITSLRGTVNIESHPGIGSTFRVRMPLTLAIIDGFLVGVNQSSFVVPLEMVLECVELTSQNLEDSAGHDYLNLRGEVLPFVRLRDFFSTGGHASRRESVVVVQANGLKVGLVVDQLMGEFQTVIKPLGKIFSHVFGIGGSTILGNGEVALILDVPGLIQHMSSHEAQS